MGNNRGQLPAERCQHRLLLQERSEGLKRMSGRIPAGREDTQSIIMSPGHTPADLGKPGWPCRHFIDRHHQVIP
jgi:hypothetical protein